MLTPKEVTLDGFSALSAEAHALNIYLLSQRISWLKRVLKTPGMKQDVLDAWLDELRHAHTLLKVHSQALQEKLGYDETLELIPGFATKMSQGSAANAS